jgi:DNA mismatch repair protein MutS2
MMNIYPNNLSEQLDFHIIIEKLSGFCFGKNAKQMVEKLQPLADFDTIEKKLLETAELLLSLHKGDGIGYLHYPEMDKELNLLRVKNSVLSTQQFHQIRCLVANANELIHFLADKEDVYPNLKRRISHVEIDKTIISYIDEIIDKDAVVRDDASPLLRKIRKELIENRTASDRAYRSHIQRLKKLGHLADFEESYVNGRRVLGLMAEHKRSFKGIVLGQSSSGKITFMEPQNLIEINNERIEFELEEQNEILRIMKDLTDWIRPFTSMLRSFYEILVEHDFISAKAKLAKELKATLPILIQGEKKTHLVNAYHPVLFLQNIEKKIQTVPIHCTFNENSRIMVISGPNAGGKSITLKTIGLLQLMLQSGMLLPISAKSEMSIQQNLFGDIGDSQSIEDGLSTYSSRLQKMKYFLQHVDDETLFLIDEFGTGSDPDMGGAMAEVILDRLNLTKAQGVITTHFTNLKILANYGHGIFNACMLFNSRTLKPLYELHVGEPGSSFTFEVAEKIGLPTEIILEAKSKLSGEKILMDKLLNQLQVEKNGLAKLKRDLQKQMSKATAEKREFKELNDKLEVYIEKSNENKVEKNRLLEFGKKLHALTQEWEQTKNKKEVITKFVKLATYEKSKKIEQEQFEKSAQFKQQKLEAIKTKIDIGSKVRMMKSKEIGIIQSVKDNRAKVLFGKIEMSVGLEKLEIAF